MSVKNMTKNASQPLLFCILSVFLVVVSVVFHFFILTGLVWVAILVPAAGVMFGVVGLKYSIGYTKKRDEQGRKMVFISYGLNILAIVLSFIVLIGYIHILVNSAW